MLVGRKGLDVVILCSGSGQVRRSRGGMNRLTESVGHYLVSNSLDLPRIPSRLFFCRVFFITYTDLERRPVVGVRGVPVVDWGVGPSRGSWTGGHGCRGRTGEWLVCFLNSSTNDSSESLRPDLLSYCRPHGTPPLCLPVCFGDHDTGPRTRDTLRTGGTLSSCPFRGPSTAPTTFPSTVTRRPTERRRRTAQGPVPCRTGPMRTLSRLCTETTTNSPWEPFYGFSVYQTNQGPSPSPNPHS